jgi:histone-lysine N-methyltransferase SETD2/UMP-CMP kinase
MIGMLKNNQVRLNYLRESLKYFTPIKKNIYLDRKRKLAKNDDMEPCFCRPKDEDDGIEHTNVSYNCGERCLNRMISTECDDDTCNCGEFCLNRKFQKHDYAYVYPVPSGGKGWGLCAG